jgi:hypothetical protein
METFYSILSIAVFVLLIIVAAAILYFAKQFEMNERERKSRAWHHALRDRYDHPDDETRWRLAIELGDIYSSTTRDRNGVPSFSREDVRREVGEFRPRK